MCVCVCVVRSLMIEFVYYSTHRLVVVIATHILSAYFHTVRRFVCEIVMRSENGTADSVSDILISYFCP